MIARTDECG